MATRSYIGQISKTETGVEVNYVYCHFDGYPSGVGKMLVDNYKDPSLVSELISLGDMSYLDERIHPVGEHSWDSPEKGVSVFYGRDRGDENTKAKFVTVDGENITHEQIAIAIKNLNEYVYVFDTESSKWLIKLGNNFKDLESIGFDESHPVYNVKF